MDVFPDGDHYAFLTEDLTAGTFGHPGQETLGVFGDRLVESLVPKLAERIQRAFSGVAAGYGCWIQLAAWLPVKRRN